MATITLPALRQNTVNLLSYAVAGRVSSSSGSGTVFGGTPARVYLNEVGLRVGDVVSGSAEILYENGGSRVEIQARNAEGTNIGEKVSDYANNTSFTRHEVHALRPLVFRFLGFEKRAMGGPLHPGVPTIVGERGPELIVSRSPGYVVPNHKMGGGGLTQAMIGQMFRPAMA